MNSRILIIYEYQILYQILNEISESLNFEITQSNSKDLKELKYEVVEIDIKYQFISKLIASKVSKCFNALHGSLG